MAIDHSFDVSFEATGDSKHMERDERHRRNGCDDDGDAPHCHCQGGRLLVLFGPVDYKTGRRLCL